MSEWQDKVVLENRFEGEDIDDENVASDWDIDSEEERVKAEELRLAQTEKEKAEKKLRIEQERRQKEFEKQRNEDPNARKLRIKREMEKSNLNIVDDLFGDAVGGSGKSNGIVDAEIGDFYGDEDPTELIDAVSKSQGVKEYTLDTQSDFDGLARDLADRLQQVKGRKGKEMITSFMRRLNKTVAEYLDVEQIKEISTSVNVVMNRKAKAKQPKKKENTKKTVKISDKKLYDYEDYEALDF